MSKVDELILDAQSGSYGEAPVDTLVEIIKRLRVFVKWHVDTFDSTAAKAVLESCERLADKQ